MRGARVAGTEVPAELRHPFDGAQVKQDEKQAEMAKARPDERLGLLFSSVLMIAGGGKLLCQLFWTLFRME